jgi:hypothetical protein
MRAEIKRALSAVADFILEGEFNAWRRERGCENLEGGK